MIKNQKTQKVKMMRIRNINNRKKCNKKFVISYLFIFYILFFLNYRIEKLLN